MTAGALGALAESRTIFLNRSGVTLTPGSNDAFANRSTLVDRPVALPPWTVDEATWIATVDCIRELFDPFLLTIVDQPPGDVPHIEAVFADLPSRIGANAGVAGLAPFAEDCGIVERAVVLTFTEVTGNDVRATCETQAQEIAHAFGLDHELLATDPMSYLPAPGPRAFRDQFAACGEDAPRACGPATGSCGDAQNSVALLEARVGSKDRSFPSGGCASASEPALGDIVLPSLIVACLRRCSRSVVGRARRTWWK